MFRFLNQVLIAMLTFNESLAEEWISLQNEPCTTRPTLINLNSDKYSQGLHCYPLS